MHAEIELSNVDPLDVSIEELRERRTAKLQRASRLEADAVGAEIQAQFYERSAEILKRAMADLESKPVSAAADPPAGESKGERLLSFIRTASLNRAQAEEKRAEAAELQRMAEHHQRAGNQLTRMIQRHSMKWLFETGEQS